MSLNKILFTSESVSEGHPDKICDQISDAILDACLLQDNKSRVACECFITTNHLIIGGEIATLAKIDYENIARNVIKKIGYSDEKWGANWKTCKITNLINTQSPDISQGVDNWGAGDQGIMFGYATNETEYYMPLAISIAHDLVRIASKLRKEYKFPYARPDMKSQVTLDLTKKNNPSVETILMSVQHDNNFNELVFKKYIKDEIMLPVIKKYKMNEDFNILINPTGRFVIGGPLGDTGLTGRKIIVDTYGGSARHGGGAFSGKDCTKVDRSGAYMARYVAKNLVAAGFADRCEIQVSYAIGVDHPISIFIETFNTNHIELDKILEAVYCEFDFTPRGMIEHLKLNQPIFQKTATYGHFGRPQDHFPWEQLDKVAILKKYLQK